MINRLLSLLGTPDEPGGAPSPHPPLQVATAVLLLEVATADDEFSLVERDRIVNTLKDRFELSNDEADELIEFAHGESKESPDLFRYTNRINDECSKDEKLAIAREIWQVIFADGVLDGHEDYLVHKLGKLLKLNHPQLIEAKLAVIRDNRSG